VEVLGDARRLGFVGRRPPAEVIAHAKGFIAPLNDCRRILDLGTGGGVPGLVIAAARPDAAVVLLDASQRRTDWLRRSVSRLGWSDRVDVVTARAEVLARNTEWRASQDAVVARGFGPPLVTAECAAPFLRVGGHLVVSEPPEANEDRWPAAALAEVGLCREAWADHAYAVFEQASPCPAAAPRTRVVRARSRSTESHA
jgi:16S rRNA (guanine527-N7)-methyltransferase